MAYELWAADTGNIVGSYPSEDEALAIVRGYVRENGTAVVASWVLAYENAGGETRQIAAGVGLVDRANGTPLTAVQ